MSANGATEQRSSFQRWVASLKRESQTDGASTVPAVPGVRPKRDDDATRVHRVPKDILLHLQARAAANAAESPHAEMTAVFRAPPELLERAKGRRSADGRLAPPREEEVTQPLPIPATNDAPEVSDEVSAVVAVVAFPDSTEATSGISQRPQGLGPRAHAEAEEVVGSDVDELLSSMPGLVEPASQCLVEPASQCLVEPASQCLVEPASECLVEPASECLVEPASECLVEPASECLVEPASECLVEPASERLVDSRDRASEPPQFRQRMGPTLAVVAFMALAAALFVLALR